MPQYLISVYGDESSFDADAIDPDTLQEMYAAVGAFNEKLQESGVWVFGGGLEAPSTATVVDNTSGAPTITDGPYTEAKEQIGGFWILDLPDLDAALALAAEGSAACQGKVEVRPFQDDPTES